jgi:hypothetical protein
MLVLLSALALARPTDDELGDEAAWEARSRALLDGPPACTVLEGRVVVGATLYQPGGVLSAGGRTDLVVTGRFEGTLDHGVWTRLEPAWDPPPPDADVLVIDRFTPMFGRVAQAAGQNQGSVSVNRAKGRTTVDVSASRDKAIGIVDQVIESTDVVTAYAEWDEDAGAVELVRLIPVDGGQTRVTVEFPGAGAPDRLEAIFPPRFKVGDEFPRPTIRDAQVHLRGVPTPLGVLPGAESASLVVEILGYTVGMHQRVTYDRARPCEP